MLIDKALTKIKQWWCGFWHGHRDQALISSDGTMYLECLNCLRCTPGWSIKRPQQAKIAGQK